MGDLIKLAAFLGTLLLSYAILSMLLQYIGFLLPLSLGLCPAASNPYSALLGYALAAVTQIRFNSAWSPRCTRSWIPSLRLQAGSGCRRNKSSD
ncbi:MAG: hypothetical protein E6K96_06210 [Thaumarchaeota archaeon]|nr:MAG: hypothetical protein E6K96_06210 [Nitrososphaerota archaeon]